MLRLLKSHSKYQRDILWNLISYAGVVLIGVGLNVLIIKFYDEAALGVFNQTYAVYIFLSQLAVSGVHLSIQYFVPKYSDSKRHLSMFLYTAIIASALTSIVVIGIGYLMSSLMGRLLNSTNVEKSLYLCLWGLLFFSFNKIILSFHNGLRNMQLFAFFQLLRFVFMLIVLLFYIFMKYDGIYLASILAFAELLLFLILIFTVKDYFHFNFMKRDKKVFIIQFLHGNKAMIGNFLLDINTKVDILTLGMFLNDSMVGLYSFSATIFEGFSQIAVLLRNNFNPLITKTFKNKGLFQRIVRINIRTAYRIIFILGVLSILFFPIVAWVLKISDIRTTSAIYLLLCGGYMITGGYHILMLSFNQLGLPKLQTVFIFIVFLSNVIFNFLLIPFMGLYGAAIGTSLSFIMQVLVTKYLFRKLYAIKV